MALIAAIESSSHPKAIARQLAFTRCSEMNVCRMIESQIAAFEAELHQSAFCTVGFGNALGRLLTNASR